MTDNQVMFLTACGFQFFLDGIFIVLLFMRGGR